jgi:hypothetical protein
MEAGFSGVAVAGLAAGFAADFKRFHGVSRFSESELCT